MLELDFLAMVIEDMCVGESRVAIEGDDGKRRRKVGNVGAHDQQTTLSLHHHAPGLKDLDVTIHQLERLLFSQGLTLSSDYTPIRDIWNRKRIILNNDTTSVHRLESMK